jgi:hypothetical protein
MSTMSEYERWKQERQAQEAGAASVVLNVARATNPDEYAKDAQLGAAFGMPSSFARDNRGVLEERMAQKRASTVLAKSPRLAAWLRNEENAVVAQDDLEGLSWFEMPFAAGGNAIKRGVMRIPQGINQSLAEDVGRRAQDRGRSFGEILSDERSTTVNGERVDDRTLIPGPLDLLFAGTRYGSSRLTSLLGRDDEAAAVEYQRQAGQAARRIQAVPMSPAGERGKSLAFDWETTGDVWSDLGMFAERIAESPGDFTVFLFEIAAESLPALAAATAGTAITRSPAIGGSIMGTYSAGVERFTSPVEFFNEKGIDVSTPEGARAVFSNPDLMREAAKRGVLRGLVIGAMDGLSGGIAGKQLAESPMGNMLLQSVTQAMMGGGGELGAQLATGEEIDIREVIIEALAEFALAPIEVAGVGGRAFLRRQQDAKQAEERRELFGALAGNAANSKVRGRLPQAFQNAIAAMTRDGPVENIYVPADKFNEYFQSRGDDWLLDVEAELGITSDDIQTALATGGDVMIPTAAYAAKMAGTDADAFFADNMRFSPDEMTLAEARAFNENAREALDQAYAEVAQMQAVERERQGAEGQIFDTMLSRLREAGRSLEVARAEAAIYPAFYRTMANREGMTLEEFTAKFPLPQVRGETPELLKNREVDAVTRTLAALRGRRTSMTDRQLRGQSLVDFMAELGVSNDGGEIRDLLGGRVSVRPGQRSIFRDDGMDLDRVAQAALEAGFMQDDPQAQSYLEAIRAGTELTVDARDVLIEGVRREMAGELQFRADPNREEAQLRQRELDELEDYLNSIGVDLDTMTDAEARAAIDAAVAADGQTFEQAARREPVTDGISSGVRLATNLANAFTMAQGKRYTKGRELKVDLQRASLAAQAEQGIDLTTLDDENIDRLADFVFEDALEAVQDNANAIGWYDRTVTKALETIGELHPEILTEPASKLQFVWALAVTSNGLKVDKNFEIALKAYEALKASPDGKFPKGFGIGQAAAGIESGLAMYATMLEKFGGDHDALTTFMNSKVPVRDIENEYGVSISGEGKGALVRGASILGPKIGNGFFSNLYGNFDELTMDRWLMRSVGRWRGTLIAPNPKMEAQKRTEIKDLIAGLSAADRRALRKMYAGSGAEISASMTKAQIDTLAEQTAKLSMDPEWRAEINLVAGGLDLRKAGNALAKYLDGQVEAPAGARERAFIRDVFNRGLDRLREQPGMEALTMSDLQALLWYPEKRLYDTAKQNDGESRGYEDEDAPDYANAARKLVRDRLGSDGRTGRAGRRTADDGRGVDAGSRAGEQASEGVGPRLLFQSYGEGARGSITFPVAGVGNGETVVNLFQRADLSTFIHETGHYFLTVTKAMAEGADASQGIAGDWATIRGWWGSEAASVARDGKAVTGTAITDADVLAALENGTTGDAAKDRAVDVGMQEQWARAFETYTMSGKAPTAELRGAFEKFRSWLLEVYRRVKGLGVNVTPEITAVMDRMLATDQEIATAGEAISDAMLFESAEAMGVSAQDYAALKALHDQARDQAAASLLKETMAPIRRQRETWFKEERANVREEVEREVNAQKVYRALEWLGNRRWLGEGEQPRAMPDMRLSKDALVDAYGPGVLKTLPRGKFTVYAVEGGMRPDEAAGWFGFSSGDEMVKALEAAPRRVEAIEAQTDVIMNERHGDVLNDGTVQEEALAAMHGDKRGQFLAAELNALTKSLAGFNRPAMTAQQSREIARQTIARMPVRDAIRTQRFLAAERKAAQEAQRLTAIVTRQEGWTGARRRDVANAVRSAVREGDASATMRINDRVDRANESTGKLNELIADLVDAKRRQLLNHSLYNESRKVADEVAAAENVASRLGKASTRKKLAGDYLDAIDGVLEQYDFRKLGPTAEQRRGALNAYVARMTADGRQNELAIPQSVLDEAQRIPYKTLSVERLRGVVDTLKNIEHTARLKQKLLDAKSERDLDAVVEEITDAFDANVKKRPPGRVATAGENRRNTVRGFMNAVLTAGTLLREIDGFKDMGAAYRNIKAPIDAAMNRLSMRREKAAIDLEGLYGVYTKAERRAMARREFIPDVGESMSKWERISVALNMGNADNLQRMQDERVGGSFTPAQMQAIVSTLDARDAAFVQSVWDYINSFWPDIEARERRITGTAPAKVEGQEVTIGGVTLKGGYYPLKYDGRLSGLARDDAMGEIAAAMQGGRFGKAQTKNGHTKERAASSGRPVMIDIAVLHQHVNEVIYDLELSEPVTNSWRILQDRRVRDAFTQAGKQPDFDTLELWMKDIAEGEQRSADTLSRLARQAKSNFTAAKLAFNVSTMAVQLTGVAQSMVVVGKRNYANSYVQMVKRGWQETHNEIAAKSHFMRQRMTTFNKDIFDLYNDPKMGPTQGRWLEFRNEKLAPAGLWGMTRIQYHLVDVPTWMAGYEIEMKRSGDESKAVIYADDVVKRAQASGLFSDRSAIERGTLSSRTKQNEFVRLFTTLGSYMFAKFNVAYERTQRAGQNIDGFNLRSAQEVASWTIDMMFLFTLEAILYAMIKGRLPDDEDEDDTWGKFLAKETALSVLSTIPLVRDVGSVLGGFEGGGAWGGITKELAAPIRQMGKDEIDAAFVKSIINATGLATGIPSSQINRFVDAGWRQMEGEDVSPLEYGLGRINR